MAVRLLGDNRPLKMLHRKFPDGEARYYLSAGTLNREGGLTFEPGERGDFALVSRVVHAGREGKVRVSDWGTDTARVVLMFPEGGPVTFRTGATVMKIFPTQYGLLYVNRPYTIATAPQPVATHRMAIILSLSLLTRLWRTMTGRPAAVLPRFDAVVQSRPGHLNTIARLLFQGSASRAGGWGTADRWIEDLAFWIFHHHPHNQRNQLVQPILQPIQDAHVHQLLGYLHEHFTDKTAVRQGAEAIGISSVKLYQKFLQATGLSPMEYLQRYRIERAQALLRETSRTIQEVAEDVGYNPSHLGRAFRAYTGLTPKRFQREIRNPHTA